ncbi:MAG: DUF2784 domain-containing protein [Gemmatimonadales bacterium]
MIYRLLASAVVAIHGLFIVFVVFGGFLTWRWRWVAIVHVPCAIWGVVIELYGWICPLTPLENALRAKAGEAGYSGGFIDHYIVPLIYPGALTPRIQVVLGMLVLLVNLLAYGVLGRRLLRGS